LKYHLGQIRGGDIKIYNDIPRESKDQYRHSIQEYFARKQLLLDQKHKGLWGMDNHLATATEKYEKVISETRKKRGQKTPRTDHGQRKEPIPFIAGKYKLPIPSSVGHSASIASGVSAMASIDLTSSDPPRRWIKKPKNMRQPSLSVPIPNGVAIMDVMVANFLQSNALHESLSNCPLLAAMIEQVHRVSLDYKPPNRQAVGSTLLDANYDTVMEKAVQAIEP